MNPITISKSVVDAVVGIGVGAVVGNAIKMSTPADVKLPTKICITVGGFVLSGLVAHHASKHATEQIDITLEQIKELKENIHALKNN